MGEGEGVEISSKITKKNDILNIDNRKFAIGGEVDQALDPTQYLHV